ncbi:MAG: esterase family protein [Clostridia bacterium]|nr:esterase family protein [Clostridia bacterium]
MAFLDFHFYSEVLGMQTEAYVILPQRQTRGEIGVATAAAGEKYKCLYLLHGLSDDHTIWLRRTSIERYATAYGIAVVMPNAHRSFYSDMACGLRYYTYISKELPRIVCEFFPVSERREDTFVAGLSMGGYGALKLALRNGDRFAAAAGLSAVADLHAPTIRHAMKLPFGDEAHIPDEDDLFYLAESMAGCEPRPRLYMAVGTEDALCPDNRRLRDKLLAGGYDCTYLEAEGHHSWDFWDTHIRGALRWLLGK